MAEIQEVARSHAPDAVKDLAEIARSGWSEVARIAAVCALLDRGFGKQKVTIERDALPLARIVRVIAPPDGRTRPVSVVADPHAIEHIPSRGK